MATPLPFNANWYLQQNPDVAAAIVGGAPFNAQEHFLLYGRAEGRSASPVFDSQQYLANNPDVAEAVAQGLITAWDHFELFGGLEGRSPTPLFNASFYLQQNPDVAAAIEQGIIQSAAQHFVLFGQSEPRPINPAIDLGRYLNANPDVAQAAANGLVNVFDHLAQYGVGEGRPLGNGISLSDFSDDPGFTQALNNGNGISALVRVQEVAPFIPTFERPAGWTPPANTPVPVDFVPPAGSGIALVVPPEVVVQPDVVLPPAFAPVQPAPSPSPTPTPTPVAPGGGGGGEPPAPTFTVTNTAGTLNFGGDATGAITFTIEADKVIAVRGGITRELAVDTSTLTGSNVPAGTNVVVAAGTLVLTAAQAQGRSITGTGNLTLTGQSTIAQVLGIDFGGVDGVVTYSITDSAAAILAQIASDFTNHTTVIENAVAVATNDAAPVELLMVDALTLSNAVAKGNAGITITNGYSINDTAASILKWPASVYP